MCAMCVPSVSGYTSATSNRSYIKIRTLYSLYIIGTCHVRIGNKATDFLIKMGGRF